MCMHARRVELVAPYSQRLCRQRSTLTAQLSTHLVTHTHARLHCLAQHV